MQILEGLPLTSQLKLAFMGAFMEAQSLDSLADSKKMLINSKDARLTVLIGLSNFMHGGTTHILCEAIEIFTKYIEQHLATSEVNVSIFSIKLLVCLLMVFS